jgi:hypothetical protein
LPILKPMVSPPTSRLRFISSVGDLLEAPPEWAPCRIEIDAEPDSLASLELRRGEERLQISLTIIDGTPKVIAEWPRAGAGSYRIYLRHPDGDETLECSIRPEKLTQAAFEALLEDLQQRLPATIAIALQKAGALAGLTIVQPQETTLAEELNRLTRACSGTEMRAGLSDVLRAVAREPHHMLRGVDVWTRREKARRIDPTRLHQAFARPENLTHDGVPLRVPEKKVEHSIDVYENRLLRTYFDQVDTRLRALERGARLMRSPAVADHAGALLKDLTRARLDASFLDEVGELNEPPARLTLVLLKRSDYRSALEGFLEFRRSAIVELDEPLLAAPLTNLPKLYETWGALEVIAAFLNLAVSLGYTVKADRLVSRSASRIWVEILKDGRAAVELEHPCGQKARLVPQRSYPARGTGLHSVSFAKRPDVAIEITDPEGRTEIWIFDPKYKLDSETRSITDEDGAESARGAPKPQDINAMHAYRDAIRDSRGGHLVRFAAILYPGPSHFYGTELAALEAQPLNRNMLATPLAQILSDALEPRAAAIGRKEAHA